MKNILSILLMSGLLGGCAVGPLVSHETARTVGASNHELVGGYGMAGLAFKWNYGLTDDLDLGFQYESLSLGLRAKYAFVNKPEGWSWAGALGLGSSVGGNHYYGDLIGSHRFGAWEPYGTLRIVFVKTDPIEFRDKDTGKLEFTLKAPDFTYGQMIVGTRYWFNDHWLLSLEASNLFAVSGIDIGSSTLFNAALGYRF